MSDPDQALGGHQCFADSQPDPGGLDETDWMTDLLAYLHDETLPDDRNRVGGSPGEQRRSS